MNMPRFAARLHVLMASAAPVGVVIRRGPAKRVATYLWDRTTDEFQIGQWLKGRIYARRSDLSPDGRHFLYFAMNGKRHLEPSGYWTAISRAPYLKALALFPEGDTWSGGGLWTSNTTYWHNPGCWQDTLWDTTGFEREPAREPSEGHAKGCAMIYFQRLVRDGWTMKEVIRLNEWHWVQDFEKPLPHGWALRKRAHGQVNAPVGKGCHWDEHALLPPLSGSAIECPEWEWAERDGDRLVWATEGRLQAGRLTTEGVGDQTVLHDFNEMVYASIQAPY